MLTIRRDKRFKQDYKRAVRRGCNPEHFVEVVTFLANKKSLPDKYRDHKLINTKEYKNVS